MRRKKEIPIIVLEALEPFIRKKDDRFTMVEPGNSLLKFVDSDSNSDFFFVVEGFTETGGKTNLKVAFKPKNKNTTVEYHNTIDTKLLSGVFKNWTDRLSDYEKLYTVFDDPIIKNNAQKFYEQFKILDDDADEVGFDLEQQLVIDEYLTKTTKKLKALKKKRKKAEQPELNVLEQEVEEIRKSLTKESKNKVMKRLAKFWGRAQKTGLEVIKEVFVSVIAELTKRLMIGP